MSLCLNLSSLVEPSSVHSTNWKGSLSIGIYLNRVKTVVDDLAAVGQPLDDQTVTHYVVNGLYTVTLNRLLKQLLDKLIRSIASSYRAICKNWTPLNPLSMLLHEVTAVVVALVVADIPEVAARIVVVVSEETSKIEICNKRGHTVIQCHNRFNLSSQPPAPPEARSTQLDNSSDSAWYIDSGASHHISSYASLLTDSGPYNGPDQVMLGDGSDLPISAIGTFNLTLSLPLQEVISVPSSLKNLLSVSKLTADHNCQVIPDSNGFRVQEDNTGKLLLKGWSRNDF
ncbi:hypothetical protein H6P81_016272 [Aristolochia fimbriata]|uniref:Retrovirus-related Pol polyprotein from transposon TNT 1-94-like beta-barrel domain-containing protein n=1 Tax=Aristolochia fimbriata TaxID=158543 RepID=A0AAV7EB22_ARIFI|nr:hypothetical protein H6P81_016272 [Aristolochia fimbriata]